MIDDSIITQMYEFIYGLERKSEGVKRVELKMYVINEGDLTTDWVVAESEEQAVGIYEELSGINLYEEHKDNEFNDLEDYIREMSMSETMTYYPDGKSPEKDTIENLIKKYCTKPDFFATSEF